MPSAKLAAQLAQNAANIFENPTSELFADQKSTTSPSTLIVATPKYERIESTIPSKPGNSPDSKGLASIKVAAMGSATR